MLAGGGGGGDKTTGGGDDKTGGGDKTAEGGEDQGGEGGEEGATPKPPKRPPPKKPGADEEEKDEYKGQKGVFFIAVTGGSGLGLIKGEGELIRSRTSWTRRALRWPRPRRSRRRSASSSAPIC